jgi:hypothetical protein
MSKEEIIARRMARKEHLVKDRLMITPYPISSATFGDKISGSILRYMFPCEGIITKGFVKLGSKPKNGVFVDLKITGSERSSSKGLLLIKTEDNIELNLNVAAGDCLDVNLDPREEIVNEVWISFLWKPTIKDIEIKSYLLSELTNEDKS